MENPIAVDGKKIAADLLSRLDEASRTRILREMREREPVLARDLEAGLFDFAQVLSLAPSIFQKLWADVSERTWSLALRGASDSELELLKRVLSARAFARIQESVSILGPQKKTAIEEARRKVVSQARPFLEKQPK